MFLKDKYLSDSSFDKIKARLVAGGDKQDKNLYDNLSSPTVSLEAVLATIAIAAVERRKIAIVDITGAYLEVELPDEDEVFMVSDPVTARILVQMDKDVASHIQPNGTITVKLARTLYGCVQSTRLWYECLLQTLNNYLDLFKNSICLIVSFQSPRSQ